MNKLFTIKIKVFINCNKLGIEYMGFPPIITNYFNVI